MVIRRNMLENAHLLVQFQTKQFAESTPQLTYQIATENPPTLVFPFGALDFNFTCWRFVLCFRAVLGHVTW